MLGEGRQATTTQIEPRVTISITMAQNWCPGVDPSGLNHQFYDWCMGVDLPNVMESCRELHTKIDGN